MFYFDYNPHHAHYGTIRQQIWTFFHFPYHLALVLSAEGLRQFTTFYSFLSGVTALEDHTIESSNNLQDLITWLRGIFRNMYTEGSSKTVLRDYPYITNELDMLQTGQIPANETSAVVNWMVQEIFIGFSEYVGIELESEAPRVLSGGDMDEPATESFRRRTRRRDEFIDWAHANDDTTPFEGVFGLYQLVFNYFFASLGVIFIMYGCFAILVRRKKDFYDYLSIFLRFAIAAVMFGLLGVRRDWNEFDHYMGSPWIIPTVCILLFAGMTPPCF